MAERISGAVAKAEELRWRIKGNLYHEITAPSVVVAKFGKHFKPDLRLEKVPGIQKVLSTIAGADKHIHDEEMRENFRLFNLIREEKPEMRPLFSDAETRAIRELLSGHIDAKNQLAVLDGLYSLGLHLSRREQEPIKAMFSFIMGGIREERGLQPHEQIAISRLSVGDRALAEMLAHAEFVKTDEGIKHYLGSLGLTEEQLKHFHALIGGA